MAKVTIERKTDWSLRNAVQEDKEGIKSLYKKYIWRLKDADVLYRWKYEDNPFGKTFMNIGVNSNNGIISNLVFMPWIFTINKKRVKALQAVDGLIELKYRGQGLALEQLNIGINIKEELGYNMCFAFPNEAGALVHKKNNGFNLGYMLRYTKPLKSEYLFNRIIRIKIISKLLGSVTNIILLLISKETYYRYPYGLAIKKIEACGREFDDFWYEFSSNIKDIITTERSSKFLQWKYIDSPNKNRQLFAALKNNKICGTIVLESSSDIGYIVDIIGSEDKITNSLISYAIRYFRRLKKNSIVFVSLQDNMYYELFKKFGFAERPEKKNLYLYLSDNLDNKEFFKNPKNWFITIGDCDIEKL